MKDILILIKIFVWWLIINLAIVNNIFTEPVSYAWAIEIVVLLLSIVMVYPIKKQIKKGLTFSLKDDIIISERGTPKEVNKVAELSAVSFIETQGATY